MRTVVQFTFEDLEEMMIKKLKEQGYIDVSPITVHDNNKATPVGDTLLFDVAVSKDKEM